ncbi:hypothetical protein CROQUDRAFT_662511 [Cronartium quercuum f. sp. fusiforme G11]|uniref:Endoplasmic reticulum junction formation protein lunapark n=1 Tax=Cronartium quercuum f. sp. fusiforme G11 TaxID=708437 RepID=A0A9P6T8C1_9BASI|nr:hypothetical protein CROQUDRAFT_662511 [Cronartium quercuum f. sp. fusiforme G11]
MGILSLFKSQTQSNSPDVFEKELSELELKIERHQDRLQAIKERERTTTFVVTTYSLLFWCFYCLLWYLGLGWCYWKLSWKYRRLGYHNSSEPFTKLDQILELVPIVLVPIGLMFARQLCQSWYTRKHETEKVQLRQLQKQLREKVEELKKKTSYYTTRELLERYDDQLKTFTVRNDASIRTAVNRSPSISTPNTLRQRPPPSSTSPNPQLTTSISLNSMNAPQSNTGKPRNSNPAQLVSSPAGSNRGWADRFAEALLGDDEAKPETKYALICLKCFNHNGLVRQEELDTIQYVCPRCGTFNPSKTRRSHSPTLEGIPRSTSAHPSYGSKSRSRDLFSTFANENSKTLTDVDERIGQDDDEGNRISNKRVSTRKSLGIPISSSTGKLVQQKRSTSSTLHDKRTRNPSDDLPALPPSRNSSSSSLSSKLDAEGDVGVELDVDKPQIDSIDQPDT